MIYDLAIVGDGVFGKLFLWELTRLVNKSQNFSIAHISSDKLAPRCSTRTTSTVSKNGIEEGISELGNELLAGFNAFEEFFYKENPRGIFKSKQLLWSIDDQKKETLKRRYKNEVKIVNSSYLIKESEGVELDSYIVSPELFFGFLDENIQKLKINRFDDLLVDFTEESGEENIIKLNFKNSDSIKARKLILATGAYSRIFHQLFLPTDQKEKILNTKIVAGSYLIKNFDHHEDLYFTINGHNLVYRKETQELIIGSTTIQGPEVIPDLISLNQIFCEVKKEVNLELGLFEDYQIVTGLRHKGQKRLPFFKAITPSKNVWFFNGAYKNGWSLPFYYVSRDFKSIISEL